MDLNIVLAMPGTLYHSFELCEMDILAWWASWHVRVSLAIPYGLRRLRLESYRRQLPFENDFNMAACFV